MLHLFWSCSILFLVTIQCAQAQQTYVDNRQLDCENNYATALGYTCNARTSCRSYITFRSQPPPYNTPLSIATLLTSNADDITNLNNFSSTSANIPADTVVVVPIRNCSCSGRDGGYYQHNASYELKSTNETYFSVANNTFQGLTTCQAMISQNTYNYRNLRVGNNITVPLRCACPTANQTAAGIRYLLTYLITWRDNIAQLSATFGVNAQSILDANELSASHIIFPFTPLLIPLTTEPTRINVTATPALPPAPPVIPVAPSTGGGSSSKWVFVGVGIGVGLLLIVLLSGALVWFFRRRKIQHKQHNVPPPKHSPNTMMIPNLPESNSWSVSSEGIRIAIESLTVYKYEELQKATNDFAEENKLKGSVYKGIFNGDYAAVKIMKGDVSNEINILKQINHSNIIRLSGFCVHQGNTYLVYEFADNGSVTDWLHSTTKYTKYESVLDWKQRVQIAHDVADALNYLHNYVNPPYVHKNLKNSNVLLDANMRAKITNFGLARTVDEEKDDGGFQLTRHVVGTFGYMPPEYIENGLITPKMDVFALGVLIAELLSGKEAITRSTESAGDKKNDKEVQLSEMIKEVLAGDNVREKLTSFMDGRLRGEYPLELAYSMAEVASKCVATDLNDRPSVTEVFMTLSKILSSSLDWDPSDELEHSRSLSIGR
ncbi:protein LYK5 [Tanacetum coccineum]